MDGITNKDIWEKYLWYLCKSSLIQMRVLRKWFESFRKSSISTQPQDPPFHTLSHCHSACDWAVELSGCVALVGATTTTFRIGWAGFVSDCLHLCWSYIKMLRKMWQNFYKLLKCIAILCTTIKGAFIQMHAL